MLQPSEAARLFDRVVHGVEALDEVFLEDDAGDDGGAGWTPIATPRSAVPVDRLQQGDVVVQRALGDGRLASTRVIANDADAHALYGQDGRIRHDTLVLRRTALDDEVASPAPATPTGRFATTATKVPEGLQIVLRSGTPVVGAKWTLQQGSTVLKGTLNNEGRTGSLTRPGTRFDPTQSFRLHVDHYVCCIVSGAALVVQDASVQYGGQFVDWRLAEAPDTRARDNFWKAYGTMRAYKGALEVFSFLQHDHVMRRPVKLIGERNRAVFEARPLTIRVGPLVRFVDATRALIWMELETPGVVRVTFGKASAQTSLPSDSDVPAAVLQRFATTVRVGGRHFALVWIDKLEPDTVFQYTVALEPQPLSDPLPKKPEDFAAIPFSRDPVIALNDASVSGKTSWLFFRTTPRTFRALRFAHGSCRKYPDDYDTKRSTPGADMLAHFGTEWLPKKSWADWPQFFVHTGDQIYADDIGVLMSGSIVRHRTAAVVPGPAGTTTPDVASGAWAGRFAGRYVPAGMARPKSDLEELEKFGAKVLPPSAHDIEQAILRAKKAREQAAFVQQRQPLPIQLPFQVLNSLLWEVPVSQSQIPLVGRHPGLVARQSYRAETRTEPKKFQIEWPGAGDIGGVHATDFAEYASLYEQAWMVTGARRVLAHVPSFMIFDDHEVTDDWNADAAWLNVVNSAKDSLQLWPNTMTDALCAYWVYQGWGNLPPEGWSTDPRVAILERCRDRGIDALPELRRLVASRAVGASARGDSANKLDWNFTIPTDPVPFVAIDLRTDREAIGSGKISPKRFNALEQTLAGTKSPVAFIVLPVPFLLPDPILYIFSHPWLVSRMAGYTDTDQFKRASDIEHPAGNEVWDQIKNMLQRLQAKSSLKTVVFISGDIHFSCNFDGQLPGSHRGPRLLQLVSSGLRQRAPEGRPELLVDAYRGAKNVLVRSQGQDVYKGIRITVGGLRGRDRKLENFLWDPSLAIVELALVTEGAAPDRLPLIRQTNILQNNEYTFEHLTKTDGRARMLVKDPGFAHPTSTKDYPVADRAGIAVFERFETLDPAEDKSSLDPGQSIGVDGQVIRSYADGVAWYTPRRAVLVEQQNAFAKEKYPVPDGVADLIAAADARLKAIRPLGAAPLGDDEIEAMLVWFDRYVEVLKACDRQGEVIANDRFRAAQEANEKLKEQFARLQPQLRDVQRSAFRADKNSTLKEVADTFATALDSVLVADKWVLEAASRMDDIRVLGTTLRTQKALHGSTQSWNELMRKTTNAKVAKILNVANGLNKVLAAWQLADASLTLLSGGKTASDTGSAGVSFAATAASAGGTLLGASGFFSLYTNLYIGPMVKHILGQIDQLKDQISKYQNHPWIQLGKLDYVNWDLEPGGRPMYEYMHAVMKTKSANDVKPIPKDVAKYFDKYRKSFDAGTTVSRASSRVRYADFDDKRYWVSTVREDIWGMLYGAMPVP